MVDADDEIVRQIKPVDDIARPTVSDLIFMS